MSNDQEFRMPSDIHDPFTDDDGAAGEEDPLAPTGTWAASKWDGAGGSAQDDQGNAVIMTKEGNVVTITPHGSSITKADGTTSDDYVDPNDQPVWDADLGPKAAWTVDRFPAGGGSAMDDQGNTVIMTKEGAISTITPSGSSATTANGRVFGGRPSAADGASSGSDDLSVDE